MQGVTIHIQKWQGLIAAGQLDFALDALLDYFRENSAQLTLVLQLRQRLSTLQNQQLKNIISSAEHRLTLNQISHDTLSYLASLHQNLKEENVEVPSNIQFAPNPKSITLQSARRIPAPEPPQKLINDLAKKKVIPMIGAGLSIAARIAGEGSNFMPDYHGLLSQLLDSVENRGTLSAEKIKDLRALLVNEETAKVAKTMKSNLGSEIIFFQELRAILNPIDDNVLGSQVHDLLRTLDFRHLITTNYDRILEKFVCPRHEVITPFDHRAFQLFSQSLTDRAQENDKYLLKMHGDITRPETIPFGEEQLSNLYEDINDSNPAFRDFLNSIFKNNTLLFLGFSFKSDSEGYVHFLRNLVKRIGGNTQTHYALVPAYSFDSEAALEYRQKVTEDTGIVFIEYVPDLQHSQVWEFISYLNTGKQDEPVIGKRWAQWYRPKQRSAYLEQQLAIERNARSVRYLTPKLTNAIATDEFLNLECRDELLQKVAYGEAEEYRNDVENQIIPLMFKRRDNLYQRLRAGKLEARALFLRSELDLEMQNPTPNLRQRYTELVNLLESNHLDLEIRLLDGIEKSELARDQATFAIIFSDQPKPEVDVTTAYASQANLDLFQLHMVEINTNNVMQKNFQFERYWASAWSEQQSKKYILDWLARLP